MAITCPRCGADYDATLFQFGHRVRCCCGAEVSLPRLSIVSTDTGKNRTSCCNRTSAMESPQVRGCAARITSVMLRFSSDATSNEAMQL